MKEQVTYRLSQDLINKIKIDSIKHNRNYSDEVQVLIIKGFIFDCMLNGGEVIDFNNPEIVKDLINQVFHSEYYIM